MKIDNIYEFLQDTTDDNEKYMLYLEGDDTLPSLAEIIKEEYKNQCSFSADEAWECITNCMEYYLDSCELSIVYKKKIWKDLSAWLRIIAYDLDINIDYSENDFIENPSSNDPAIEIIKELHYYKNKGNVQTAAGKGVTKEKLSNRLKVSEKTVKDIINKLDKNYHSSELRIAGQKVLLDVDSVYFYDEEAGVRNRYFSSKSTLNPVFLQFNISQIFTLLNGCKLSYEAEERNMALYTAMEIWDQLSSYTKGRIKAFYCYKYPDFADFISDVEAEIESSEVHMYVSDREQIEDMDLNKAEIDEITAKLNY